jgi:hypothetical protein
MTTAVPPTAATPAPVTRSAVGKPPATKPPGSNGNTAAGPVGDTAATSGDLHSFFDRTTRALYSAVRAVSASRKVVSM